MRLVGALTVVLLLATPAFAAEVVDVEGGYRLEAPAGWQATQKGDRVVLTDLDGLETKGGLARGGARIWVRPIDDVNRWFEELLNRDETRNVRRLPERAGADATFEYIDALSRRDVLLQVTIVCRRVAQRSICVVLEFRVDDPKPAIHRATHAKVIDSLRPVAK